MSIRFLFIDMNSYFASVEQQLRPELRGLPVAVAPVEAETTGCIAASYEAKKYGVRTGTMVRDARRLCPDIRIVPARPRLYVAKHNEIVAAVESVLPVAEVLSVDEMACELVGDHLQVERAKGVARRIKQAIYQRAGEWMRCSIGIGPNRMLSKVAADMNKPDGLTVIRREDLPDALLPLKLTDFPGIGPRMERRLHLAGVTETRQLVGMGYEQLCKVWGGKVMGGAWFRQLRGEHVPGPATRRRSLGHSRVLEPELRNDRDARAIVIRLLHKAAARLRHVRYCASSISLSISHLGRGGHFDSRRIEPTQDTLELIRHVSPMWERRSAGTPLKVGVVLGDLTPENNVTPSLFEPNERKAALAAAMDEANRKCGRTAVYFGGMFGKGESVSTRIAFGTVPDLELTDC